MLDKYFLKIPIAEPSSSSYDSPYYLKNFDDEQNFSRYMQLEEYTRKFSDSIIPSGNSLAQVKVVVNHVMRNIIPYKMSYPKNGIELPEYTGYWRLKVDLSSLESLEFLGGGVEYIRVSDMADSEVLIKYLLIEVEGAQNIMYVPSTGEVFEGVKSRDAEDFYLSQGQHSPVSLKRWIDSMTDDSNIHYDYENSIELISSSWTEKIDPDVFTKQSGVYYFCKKYLDSKFKDNKLGAIDLAGKVHTFSDKGQLLEFERAWRQEYLKNG